MNSYVRLPGPSIEIERREYADREIANTSQIRLVVVMSTVAEIESALEKLPIDMQREVAAWLEAKLWPETPAMLAAIGEAERSLAEEGGIPVEEVRRNLGRWITK